MLLAKAAEEKRTAAANDQAHQKTPTMVKQASRDLNRAPINLLIDLSERAWTGPC
jgi:hypothetical protein